MPRLRFTTRALKVVAPDARGAKAHRARFAGRSIYFDDRGFLVRTAIQGRRIPVGRHMSK